MTFGSRLQPTMFSSTGLLCVVGERLSAIDAEGDALGTGRDLAGLSAVGQDGHDGLVIARLKPGRILPIDDGRARPAAAPDLVRRQRAGELLPVHQIGADRMAPVLVGPRPPRRLMLKAQVIDALVVEQSVGIVDPVLLRREVELGAIVFRRSTAAFCRPGWQRR